MRNFIEISQQLSDARADPGRNTIENVLSNVLSCIVLLHKCHQRVCGVCMLHEIKRGIHYMLIRWAIYALWGNHPHTGHTLFEVEGAQCSQPRFCMMVSRPCGPIRISLMKLRMLTQMIGLISTPATGGTTLRVGFSSGSVGAATMLHGS